MRPEKECIFWAKKQLFTNAYFIAKLDQDRNKVFIRRRNYIKAVKTFLSSNTRLG